MDVGGLHAIAYGFSVGLEPLNLLAWAKNRPYNALAAELWSPWDLVQAHCEPFECASTQLGMGYIAWGRLKQVLP